MNNNININKSFDLYAGWQIIEKNAGVEEDNQPIKPELYSQENPLIVKIYDESTDVNYFYRYIYFVINKSGEYQIHYKSNHVEFKETVFVQNLTTNSLVLELGPQTEVYKTRKFTASAGDVIRIECTYYVYQRRLRWRFQ